MEILLFILSNIYWIILNILYCRWSIKQDNEYLEKIIKENGI